MIKPTDPNVVLVLKGFTCAPSFYWELTEYAKKQICNGAGAKGWGWIVPDTIYGLSITEDANIHDFCYEMQYGKDFADELFYNNMIARIENRVKHWWNKPLAFLRKRRALKYYKAVEYFGNSAYKKD